MPELPIISEEPSSLRLALTLGIFGLASGLLLVGAYELTLPVIEKHDKEVLREAVFKVVPDATSMKKLVRGPSGLEPARPNDDSAGVYAAYDAHGKLEGYALVGDGPGFQDVIRLIYGVDVERRRITGMEVLESRETPGLGNKISKDPEFKKNFENLLVDPEVVPVRNKAAAAPENQVDIITGATISSNAVVSIINQTNARWFEALPKPGDRSEESSLGPTRSANTRGAKP